MKEEVLLQVDNLCQYFGENKAVDGVSFSVRKGEVFGLVGESGCGKTTTGRSIIRIYPITSGNVYFKGQRICAGVGKYQQEIRRLKQEKNRCPEKIAALKREIALAREDQKKNDSLVRKIQMIFQDPMASLDPRMTVREIIAEGLIISGIRDRAYIDEKVYEILELVGLVREHAGRYPHEFSGGQRQRIGIARAIIMNPELLIADEPISALDVSIQAQVMNLLQDLREKMGLTILFIAHDLSVVKYFCDRIGVMYLGKLVELAPAEELFAHPLHPYTKSLLSAIPIPDPRAEKKRRRIVYRPAPAAVGETMQEIVPGHWVYGSDRAASAYRMERSL